MKKNVWRRLIPMKIPGEPERMTDQQKGECIKWKRSGSRMQPYIHHYTKNEVIAYHNRLAYHLLRYRPEKPLTGSVGLYITWMFPTDKKKEWGRPKTTRPDLDNMAKGILDVLTELKFWRDDNQVVELCLVKYWSSPEGAGTFINLYYDHDNKTIETEEQDPEKLKVRKIDELLGEESLDQMADFDRSIEATKQELIDTMKKNIEVVDFRSEGLPWE